MVPAVEGAQTPKCVATKVPAPVMPEALTVQSTLVLSPPVVLFCSAKAPLAELSAPEVFDCNARFPTAVLAEPPVLFCSAPAPTPVSV